MLAGMRQVTSAKELLERYGAGERVFEEANLNGADLSHADLSGANLIFANLSGANLSGANLNNANLNGADLSHADLSGANLNNADLSHADLSGANLSKGTFNGARFYRTEFADANLTGLNIGGATLSNVDLNLFCQRYGGADVHESIFKAWYGPLVVDYLCIIRSRHAPGLADFLRRCGWPQVFIDYNIECALSLDARGVFNLLQSTFISFGEPDKLFAKRLSDTLREHGSQTFFFPDHAKPGDPLVEVMYRGVHDNDRVILVCSKASLTRPAVLHETQLALDRERKLGGRMLLIPVTIDDYLLERWEPEREHEQVADALRSRVIADFRGALDDEDRFRQQVGRLVSALKKDEVRDVPEGVEV